MMQQYHELLEHILNHGDVRKDRTGTGTLGVFGTQTRYNLEDGFPLLTTKRVYWKGVVEELLWFLRGETNVRSLNFVDVHIWDAWADRHGNLGPVYGKQWRSWSALNGPQMDPHTPIDQIAKVIEDLKTDPFSRRHIVSAWNVGDLEHMALPPCHLLFQFYVTNDMRLHCQLYQRSADMFLGVPFNIASYALLMVMISHMTGLFPGEFVHTIGDAHIYLNHVDQVKEQLSRRPRDLPILRVKQVPEKIEDFKFDDFELIGYNPHPAIKGDVSV